MIIFDCFSLSPLSSFGMELVLCTTRIQKALYIVPQDSSFFYRWWSWVWDELKTQEFSIENTLSGFIQVYAIVIPSIPDREVLFNELQANSPNGGELFSIILTICALGWGFATQKEAFTQNLFNMRSKGVLFFLFALDYASNALSVTYRTKSYLWCTFHFK